MIVDDAVAFIGSANLNHRSMTNDTELHVGVLDATTFEIAMGGPPARVCKFAHEYRRKLWAEHLRVSDDAVRDPIATIETMWTAASGGRVQHHVVQIPALDTSYIAKVVTNLLMSGLALPPLVIAGLPPLALGSAAVEAGVAAILNAAPQPIIQWLEGLLNPRLVC
jgi:hypothetical protein